MAKKKKKGISAQGILSTIMILCVLAVCVVAMQKAATGPNGEENTGGTDLQATESNTSSDTEATTDSAVNSSSATTTDSDTDTAPSSSAATTDTNTDTDTDTTASTSTSVNTAWGNHDYTSSNKTDSFDKDAWYMLLANPDNPVPEGYTFEQAKISSAGRNWIVDARCAEDLKAMIAAAKKDGVSLILCSTYRTIDTQTKNFNNKVNELMATGKYTKEEATRVTATIIAVPGTSEHHTGMAADIVTPSYQRLNAGFDQTDAYKWLEANCADFGFVLRYRKDKTDITKIIYEPWHYRYVGKEAATIMMEEEISFEEFLEKYGT